MPLENRVDPFGNIFRSPARGTFMGNRGGALHNESREIVRTYKRRRWITCVLEFRGRHREIMAPRRYTELFFLDEAVAFAAGHRPDRKDGLPVMIATISWDREMLPQGVSRISTIERRMEGRTNREIAARLPADERQLENVPGLGEKRLAAFGGELLRIVAEHLPIIERLRANTPEPGDIMDRALTPW